MKKNIRLKKQKEGIRNIINYRAVMISDEIKNNLKETVHKGAGHRKRLRDRFLQSGLDGFLDYEIVGRGGTRAPPACRSLGAGRESQHGIGAYDAVQSHHARGARDISSGARKRVGLGRIM